MNLPPTMQRERSWCALSNLLGVCLLLLVPQVVRLEGQERRVDPRLNQLQVIGSHNSYHIAPSAAMMKIISAVGKGTAESIDYSHRPLREQFERLGIRQIELDIYADPEGGLFADPIGRKILKQTQEDPGPDPNRDDALSRPGMKIIHSPGFDFGTTVPTLVDALKEVRDWSLLHPTHVPIMILIEVKETAPGPSMIRPLPFDNIRLDEVDAEIRSVFERKHLLLPDDVRHHRSTLREAILDGGWPKLSECRGKVLFALDNEGSICDRYLSGHPVLEDRMMFVSVHEDHAAAAWMKINDPIMDFDRIQRLVQKGFLVRTRADANTVQSRKNDPHQRDKAFASGAQLISTDYAEPDERFSNYHVRFKDHQVARSNPVSGNRQWDSLDLEATIIP